MCAIDVSIGHDDDLVVAQLVDVELVAPDAGAERHDQCTDLVGAEHLVEARALHIEDLAAQREDCLVVAAAALLGGATGRVTLDDEEFGFRRVFLLAVGQLAGQGRDVERRLAPRQFSRLARSLAGGGGLDDLLHDLHSFFRVLLEPLAQLLADKALDHRAHLGGDELVFRL